MPSPPPPVAARRELAAPPLGMFTTRRKIAVGVAGASVVGVAAGLVRGKSARSKQDEAFRLCPEPATPCAAADRSNALIDNSHRWALEANIAFGLAAAAAIGAAVLWFTGAPEPESTARISVVPSLAPGNLAVVLLTRF